ncbi:hypothetical protein GPALN_006683 [Globodera pallida]|nr:hypothetical protein GPALN_006683 [Globodera pallida]
MIYYGELTFADGHLRTEHLRTDICRRTFADGHLRMDFYQLDEAHEDGNFRILLRSNSMEVVRSHSVTVNRKTITVRKCPSAKVHPQMSVRKCSVRKCPSANVRPQMSVRKCRTAFIISRTIQKTPIRKQAEMKTEMVCCIEEKEQKCLESDEVVFEGMICVGEKAR